MQNSFDIYRFKRSNYWLNIMYYILWLLLDQVLFLMFLFLEHTYVYVSLSVYRHRVRVFAFNAAGIISHKQCIKGIISAHGVLVLF